MKKDSFEAKLFSAAAIAAAITAGTTFAADLSSGKGPRASLPLWTSLHSASSPGYSFVVGDAPFAHSYEVRAGAATIRVDPNDANARARLAYDYPRSQAFLIRLGADPRERTFLGGSRLPIDFAVASDATPTFADANDSAADGGRHSPDARLEAAMLSATLEGNPFLRRGQPFASIEGAGYGAATPIGWKLRGDLR